MSKPTARILIVDDDAIVTDSLAEYLSAEGYGVATALNGLEALQVLREEAEADSTGGPHPIQVVLTDGNMPGMDGMQLLEEVRRQYSEMVVLVLTAYGTVESAVECVKKGAFDYLTKPVVDHELLVSLEKAIRHQTLVAENHTLRSELHGRYGLDNIVGADPRMVRIYDLIEAVAASKSTVLMAGESGTGKSMIAKAIHHRSPRRDGAFVEVSCGSIPETLLESELFGHVKGAFTGAHADKQGRFLAADGGTLFLDEINSASPGMQLKLLRVLQERKFEPVGSTETIEVDVRVLLASNQPLEELVARGEFRQDLYYRINVVTIDLPPLRERVGDIELLAGHFLAQHSDEMGKQITGFTAAAMEALRRYSYPGNVRELANIVERAVVLTKGQTITPDDLPPDVLANEKGVLAITSDVADAPWLDDDGNWRPMPLREALEEPERQILLAALRANDWNRKLTSEQLDINRTTLYKKIKQYDLERLAG